MSRFVLLFVFLVFSAVPAFSQGGMIRNRYPVWLKYVPAYSCVQQTFAYTVKPPSGWSYQVHVEGAPGQFIFFVRQNSIDIDRCADPDGEPLDSVHATLVVTYWRNGPGDDENDDGEDVCDDFPVCDPPPPNGQQKAPTLRDMRKKKHGQ